MTLVTSTIIAEKSLCIIEYVRANFKNKKIFMLKYIRSYNYSFLSKTLPFYSLKIPMNL